MSHAETPASQDHFGIAPAVWAAALVLWLVAIGLLPDARPLGTPEWSVRLVRLLFDLSEPAARTATTFVLRASGVGMIGVLLTMALQRFPFHQVAPGVLVATPMLAVGAKWFNFGYLPHGPHLIFVILAAVFGALAGLSVRRTRFALAAVVGLSVALFTWGVSTRIPDNLDEAARATGLYLLENSRDIPRGDEAFAILLERAFIYAEDNSHGTDPVFPNQAAILALGVLLGDDQVAWVARRELDWGRNEQREALRRRVTLHQRNDLSMHFWVSAALTVLSDQHRALTVGLAKELSDATGGGSGFSFVDMAANKAGIRFAVVATRNASSARSVQARIRDGVNQHHFMPDISDLPEGIPVDLLEAVYGGLLGETTRMILAEIDRRIDELEALH